MAGYGDYDESDDSDDSFINMGCSMSIAMIIAMRSSMSNNSNTQGSESLDEPSTMK